MKIIMAKKSTLSDLITQYKSELVLTQTETTETIFKSGDLSLIGCYEDLITRLHKYAQVGQLNNAINGLIGVLASEVEERIPGGSGRKVGGNLDMRRVYSEIIPADQLDEFSKYEFIPRNIAAKLMRKADELYGNRKPLPKPISYVQSITYNIKHGNIRSIGDNRNAQINREDFEKMINNRLYSKRGKFLKKSTQKKTSRYSEVRQLMDEKNISIDEALTLLNITGHEAQGYKLGYARKRK